LSNSGEVLTRSKKARAMIDLDDDNDKLRKKIETLEATITELQKDLAEAKKAPEPVPAGDPNNW
jgi:chaperonin cofactor prefoldin